jgi:hypothetical protein
MVLMKESLMSRSRLLLADWATVDVFLKMVQSSFGVLSTTSNRTRSSLRNVSLRNQPGSLLEKLILGKYLTDGVPMELMNLIQSTLKTSN